MLGLVLLYVIGRIFYDLATEKGKNGWGYAILGIVSYYAGTFIGGVIMVVLFDLFEWGNLEDINESLIGLMAFPFGLITCWLLHHYLKYHFLVNITETDTDILDADIID